MNHKPKWQPEPQQVTCPACGGTIENRNWAMGGRTPSDQAWYLKCEDCRQLQSLTDIVDLIVKGQWGVWMKHLGKEFDASVTMTGLLKFNCTREVFRAFRQERSDGN